MISKVQNSLDIVYGRGINMDPNSFAYTATQMAIVWGLKAAHKDIETIAKEIHNAWAFVAKCFDDPCYLQTPEKKARRILLANTDYSQLSEEIKDMNRLIALAIRTFKS